MGCNIALDFRLKVTSCAYFFWIWVKNYFPIFNLAKWLFSSRAKVLQSCITERKDVSSANSLAFEDKPDKSLMHIKNNNGPITEAAKTSVLTSDQLETCLFN